VREVEAADEERLRRVERDVDHPALGRPRDPLQGRAHEVVGRVELGRDGERPAGEARQVEEVGHEAVEPVRLLLDDDGALVARDADVVRQRLDRRQRRPQVVRDGGEQRVLEQVRLAERVRVLGLGRQPHALGREGRVVGEGLEQPAAGGVEGDPGRVEQYEHADGPLPDPERQQQGPRAGGVEVGGRTIGRARRGTRRGTRPVERRHVAEPKRSVRARGGGPSVLGDPLDEALRARHARSPSSRSVSPPRAGGAASPPRAVGTGGTPGPLAAASRTPSGVARRR
jgi:hypothetical protein